ncbi:PucR family transcriptional regulator [uncultured Microbacterium sp.]|uniref:PucR family transcriptional regulator n=1 Tax=uncultured Microbacterium sp. TaxID=191216 RepID=UPI0025D460D8|nr:PucR family transcriptional regulator [uncultured Microbacterium sp.]
MLPDRMDFAGDRTDRPDGADPGLPTVADVLGVASLQAGVPEVLAGSVDVPVRWVHVSDSNRVPGLLDGGELLLTTGAGWAGDSGSLARLVAQLADAGLSGIVLELGTRFAVVPPALVSACRDRDLALVTLEHEVKFVTVTEEVHRRIIAGQVEALQERQRLHQLFTGLSLRGAPVEVVIRETARALKAPVVLEDLAHETIVADTFDLAEADALGGWTERSRRLPADWTRVPVAARGTRWGELVALPGPPHPAGRATVLEQAATALALSRLADGEGAWARLRADTLLAALLGEQYVTPADIEARLESAGFPVRGRTLYAAVSTSPASPSAPGAQERDDPHTPRRSAPEFPLRVRESSPGGRIVSDPDRLAVTDVRLLGGSAGPERILLLSIPAGSVSPTAPPAELIAAFGTGALSDPALSMAELLSALPVVRRLARQAGSEGLLRVADRPLARLAAELRGDHRLQEHSARLLAPLIRHDDATGGDLLRVLSAVVSHPGNRTAAAAASHLSRSVFYQRLALIADLLQADLDDGETLSALHLALLAHAR